MQRALKEEVKHLEGKLSKNENSILFARLADAYLQMDRVDDAIELCEKGIRKHPYYVTGHYVLGKCYFKKKLFDQAEKELKRVLLFDPKYIAAHRDYGDLMAQIGWHNTCEMSYEEIIRIDPFNTAAQKRLEELKKPAVLTPVETPPQPGDRGLEEVEEDILNELTTASEKPPQPEQQPELEPEAEFEPEPELESEPEYGLESAPEPEFEPEPLPMKAEETEFEGIVPDVGPVEARTKPAAKELFKEPERVYEEDKANLDLLEDIFRDDELPDVLMDEELESQIGEDTNYHFDEAPRTVDQNYLFGEEFKFDETDALENKEFDGLDDEEVFALMAGDEEFNKPTMKSRLDISEPPARREQKPKVESREKKRPEEIRKQAEPEELEPPTEKTLYDLQKETRPRFEPPMDKTALKKQKEKQSESEAEEKDTIDTNDLQRKKEKIVTPTLGEIYAAQHQYAKAIGVYEILRKKEPDNELYKQKIEYLQKKLEESQAE